MPNSRAARTALLSHYTATAIFPAYGNCSHVSPEQHDTLTPILSNSSSQFASRDIHDTLFSGGQPSHTSFRQHLSGAAHCLGLEKHCMIHLVICSQVQIPFLVS